MNCRRIRLASLPDVAIVAPLFDLYRQFYGQQPNLPLASSYLHDRLSDGESTILLAEQDDEAVGFAQLYPGFSSVRARRTLVLNDLFVAERARGRGIARELILAVEHFARANGVDRLSLSTAVDNAPAQKLYCSLGWVLDQQFLTFTRALEV